MALDLCLALALDLAMDLCLAMALDLVKPVRTQRPLTRVVDDHPTPHPSSSFPRRSGRRSRRAGGESGVSIDGVPKDGTVENEVEDDGLAAPPVAARLFAARLDASLDADDAPSDPVGDRAAFVAVGRRRCDPDPDGEGPSGEVDE